MATLREEMAYTTARSAGVDPRVSIGIVVVALAMAGMAAWLLRSNDYPIELGQRFDPNRAIGVAEALDQAYQPPHDDIVVRGRIGEVCRSAGCWFVLQDGSNAGVHEIFVDLKRQADFTVRPEVRGRTAIVVGRWNVDGTSAVIEAVGVRIE